MAKTIGFMLLLVGAAGVAVAIPVPGPEIDPGSAVNALALLSGAALIIRASRKK